MKDNLRNENGELYEIMIFNSTAKSKIQKNKKQRNIIKKNLFFVYI